MPRSNPLVAIGRFIIFAVISWLVPASRWLGAARAVAPLSVIARRAKLQENARQFEGVLNRKLSSSDRRNFEVERSAHSFAAFVRVMGQNFSKGLDPTIRIHGTEHLDDALDNGKGAILWVAPFQYASLIAKMGFSQAGFPVSHLSRVGHGYGGSPVALRYLNRFITGIEDRYLKERLTMVEGHELATLRRMRECLRDNSIVSIALGSEAEQTRSVPCLGGRLKVAVGPPNLAFASGAPLLPVYVLGRQNDTFDVTIDRPLPIPGEDDREKRTDQILCDLTSRLGPLIDCDPEQWGAWGDLTFPDPLAEGEKEQ